MENRKWEIQCTCFPFQSQTHNGSIALLRVQLREEEQQQVGFTGQRLLLVVFLQPRTAAIIDSNSPTEMELVINLDASYSVTLKIHIISIFFCFIASSNTHARSISSFPFNSGFSWEFIFYSVRSSDSLLW